MRLHIKHSLCYIAHYIRVLSSALELMLVFIRVSSQLQWTHKKRIWNTKVYFLKTQGKRATTHKKEMNCLHKAKLIVITWANKLPLKTTGKIVIFDFNALQCQKTLCWAAHTHTHRTHSSNSLKTIYLLSTLFLRPSFFLSLKNNFGHLWRYVCFTFQHVYFPSQTQCPQYGSVWLFTTYKTWNCIKNKIIFDVFLAQSLRLSYFFCRVCCASSRLQLFKVSTFSVSHFLRSTFIYDNLMWMLFIFILLTSHWASTSYHITSIIYWDILLVPLY